MNLPGDLDELDRTAQVPANRVSHARLVWSAWNLSLMVRAGRAGRKGVVWGAPRSPAFRKRNRDLESGISNLESRIHDPEFRIELRHRRVRMTNVGYVQGMKNQPGQERYCVVRN
jgi:hypothetical protein